MRSILIAGAATLAAALGAAAPAAADSLVYVRDHNVWLANSDGSGQYQVTTDGGPSQPYGSPSQADDGTIAASRGNYVVLLRQNGTVIRQLDPPPLRNTYSHVVDGRPAHVALSLDGSRIAFSYVSFEGGGGTQAAQATTGFVDAAGAQLPGNLFNGFPAWVTSTRLVTSGGYGWHVNLHDVGQEHETNWLNDRESDLSDPDVNRQGTRLAVVRGVGDQATIVTYATVGDVLTGTPAKTANATCALGPQAGLASPTWAPDGNGLAWTEPDGIWTMGQAATCSGDQPRLTIPGGSEPDWGPAPVNPGPRETPPDPRRDTPPPDTRRGTPPDVRRDTPPDASRAMPRIRAPRTLAQLGIRGVRIRYACPSACSVTATAVVDRATARTLRLRTRVLAAGARRLTRSGDAVVVVKPSRAVTRRLAKLRRATVTLRIAVKTPGTGTRSFQRRITLRR